MASAVQQPVPPCNSLTDLFFGDHLDLRDEPGREEREANCKEICDTCPLEFSCLEYSLVTNQEYGVWGGYSQGDRRRFRSFLYQQGYRGIPTNGELASELAVFEAQGREVHPKKKARSRA